MSLSTTERNIGELDSIIERYTGVAQRELHQILVSFHLRLPREIRDLVYKSMLGPQMVMIHAQNLCFKTSDACPHLASAKEGRLYTSSEPFWAAITSRGYHHISSGRTIDNVTQEFAETFFSQAGYRFISLKDVSQYLRCRVVDFELNLKELVKSIEVYQHFQSPAYIAGTIPAPDLVPKPLNQQLASYCDSLRRLTCLKNGTEITLALHFSAGFIRPAADTSAAVPVPDVAILFPEIRKLVEAGYKVSVKVG
jgi:hypothetical protein